MVRFVLILLVFSIIRPAFCTVISYEQKSIIELDKLTKSIEVDLTYTIDDTESIHQARQTALLHSSGKASNFLSEILIRNQELSQGLITVDSFKLVGAAVIDTQIIKENIHKNHNQHILVLTLNHTLDSSEVIDVLVSSAQSESLKNEIDHLKFLNRQLENDLLNKLVNKTRLESVQELKLKIQAISELEQIDKSKQRNLLELTSTLINEYIDSVLNNSFKINSETHFVTLNTVNNIYKPEWKLNLGGLEVLLEKYFYLTQRSEDKVSYSLFGPKGQTKSLLSAGIMNEIKKRGAITLEAVVDDKKAVIPVLTICSSMKYMCHEHPYYVKNSQNFIKIYKTQKGIQLAGKPTSFNIENNVGQNMIKVDFSLKRDFYFDIWGKYSTNKDLHLIR